MARRHKLYGAGSVALAVLGLVSARDVSAQTYLITEIAPPGGHTHTVATAVRQGYVAGYSFTTAPNSAAFTAVSALRWNAGTSTSIAPLGGHTSSIGYGVNKWGEVVGTSFNLSGASFINMAAFLDLPSPKYSLSAGPNDLGDPGGGDARAYGINDSGYVVGESLDGIDPMHAFLWLPNGFSSPFGPYSTPGMKDLGTLGGANSGAYGINSLGQIVGGSLTPKGDFKGFLWAPTSSSPYPAGMTNLGAIASLADSIAYGISDNTVAAGSSYTGSANTSSRAIKYDHGVKSYYAPFNGGNYAGSNGVNSYDQLAGVSSVNKVIDSQSHAMLVSSGKTYDLNALISGGQGWTLVEATAVDDTGAIVGYGTKLQNDLTVPTRGFLLTPNFSLAPNTGVPANMSGGSSDSNGAVNLTQAIGIDMFVKLSSDNAGVHVPSGVVVTAGTSSQNFTITTDPSATGTATITATLFGVSQTSVIILSPTFTPHISSFTVTPSSVQGGATVTMTATIDTPSIGTTNIPLTQSGFPNGGLPGSLPNIVITTGNTSGFVNVVTSGVPAQSNGTIYATLNGTASAPLSINALQVQSVTFSPASVIGTDSTTVKVTLNAKAPVGGRVVNLAYGGPTAGSPPSTVTVPYNSTNTTFSLATAAVTTRTLAQVFATVAAQPYVTGNLTVNPIGVSNLSITPNPVSLSAGTTTATVTLSRPAPAGGWTVRMTSSNAAKADFAAGVTSAATLDIVVPAGSTTSNPITIYLNGTGTPNIKADGPPKPNTGGTSKSVSLSITP